jgi:hypothetical protein
MTDITDISLRLEGAEGVLCVLTERLDEDTPDYRALEGAWRLVRDCFEMATSLADAQHLAEAQS